MEVNCKRVIETIAPQQESHDVTEPIGPLFSSLWRNKWARSSKHKGHNYIQYFFEKGLFTSE